MGCVLPIFKDVNGAHSTPYKLHP
ncbi:MAG: hypothetical protein QOF89_605, partial [Acidobacteriota bacterium]|nr:hypothetical protein [Acidobacteriota bacterium]